MFCCSKIGDSVKVIRHLLMLENARFNTLRKNPIDSTLKVDWTIEPHYPHEVLSRPLFYTLSVTTLKANKKTHVWHIQSRDRLRWRFITSSKNGSREMRLCHIRGYNTGYSISLCVRLVTILRTIQQNATL